mmetsp:Transcript_13460/g.37872  ORF Transcript_13460/g.37872 Transcript_13460/m.37872 type:complete len:82 (-) Transcript_13460:2443-2688(-)
MATNEKEKENENENEKKKSTQQVPDAKEKTVSLPPKLSSTRVILVGTILSKYSNFPSHPIQCCVRSETSDVLCCYRKLLLA